MIPPGSTIGILGGGQLGRMLAIAAAEMGYHTHIYCPENDCPASEVAAKTTTAPYEDADALKAFAAGVDVITYEFENIPAAPLRAVADKIFPSLSVLEISQHRVREKQMLQRLGVKTARFAPVATLGDIKKSAVELGFPAILKTAEMGYDGKGQSMLNSEDDVEKAWAALDGAELILEAFVQFRMEISVVIARDAQGKMACYCPVQNIHKQHILRETIAPAPISPALAAEGEAIARAIAEGMSLTGLIAVEMFVTEKDEILVNELAPRPHNSGHWTLDACVTSQFEHTIRAICGLPLGSTERLCDARMINLIGDDIKDWARYMAMPSAKLHLYGKKEPRPGRKMGHITIIQT